ncbi:hypothetical protein D3C80_1416150 [compost metagenome]
MPTSRSTTRSCSRWDSMASRPRWPSGAVGWIWRIGPICSASSSCTPSPSPWRRSAIISGATPSLPATWPCRSRSPSAKASLRPWRSTAPTSPTSPPRPSGRRCSSATLSSSSCRSNPTATRCRLAGWTSTSTPGIAVRWSCRNPCLGRAPSNCCKGAGSNCWR